MELIQRTLWSRPKMTMPLKEVYVGLEDFSHLSFVDPSSILLRSTAPLFLRVAVHTRNGLFLSVVGCLLLAQELHGQQTSSNKLTNTPKHRIAAFSSWPEFSCPWQHRSYRQQSTCGTLDWVSSISRLKSPDTILPGIE